MRGSGSSCVWEQSVEREIDQIGADDDASFRQAAACRWALVGLAWLVLVGVVDRWL